MKEKYSKLREELAYITIHESFKNRSLHKECEHNINVLLGYKEVRPGMNMHNNVPVYKCLFCEAEKNSNVEIKNSIIINASNYCKDNYDMNKKEDVKNPLDSSEKMDAKIVIYFDSEYNQYVAGYCDEAYSEYYYTDSEFNSIKAKCDIAEKISD